MAARIARSDDAGFSVVEVVVAAIVLALAAASIAGVLISTTGLVRSNTQRTTAANLATQQMETLRATKALDILNGHSEKTVTVGGTTYTLAQDVTYGSLDGTACSGSSTAQSNIALKRISLTVTWPGMGNVAPVRSDTIRTLGTGSNDLSDTKGAATVAVQDASGNGSSGVLVTLKTSPAGATVATQTTGSDGCLVFTGLAAGNYVATANSTGFVNLDGAQATTSQTIAISAGVVTKSVLPYDQLGGLAITPSPSGGYSYPSNVGVTLSTSIWSPSQNRAYPQCSGSVVTGCVSGTGTRTAASLFPAKYAAWAGTCADAAPSTPTLTQVTSGTTGSYSFAMGLVNATVGTVAAGKHLYAVHAADSTCTSGEVYDFGVVTSGQVVKMALPYGLWNIQLSSTGATVTQQVTLTSPTVAKNVAVLL